MNRDALLKTVNNPNEIWDVLIIGGGATGLGAAVDSASRGYKTLLLEQADFAKATSSRSTKLIHGGLRYLQQGNITLVIEALKERGLLCHNAPHLIHHLPFLVPSYHWWEGPFYGIGLKVYDMLAGDLKIEKSRHLSREETLQAIPTLEPKDLRGGTIYYDGQFDDSRLAICLAQTAVDQGATALNYMEVTQLIKEKDLCTGVEAIDRESGTIYRIHARAIINATGVFVNNLRKKDDRSAPSILSISQGTHIVLDRSFLPGDTAILVPHTTDGRVLFMVPWHERILVGTTDTPIEKSSLEPCPFDDEIDFLLTQAAQYLTKVPSRDSIFSCFAGLRPLIKSGKTEKTASLSRDHAIFISQSGLITIAGGKWTTYRKMAEDVVNKAALIGGLADAPCQTKTLKLHGWDPDLDPLAPLSTYGTDRKEIEALALETPENAQPIHPDLPYIRAEVIWAIRKEMARTVEDILARRTRALLLNARLSIAVAPSIAKILAKELEKESDWEQAQVEGYTALAERYSVREK